tara:strand:+ start:15922 stop:16770 length:849 start_codon:yes stop_codon:yes gene_type:complete
MKNILITGANGLIGTYLTKRLNEEKDFKINKIDRSFGDISQEKTWKNFPVCDLVIHLAAKILISESRNDPNKFLDTNVNSTVLALDYCKKNKSKLIFLSSYLYDSNKISKPNKDKIPEPANAYILSKKISEEKCKFYFDNYGVNTLILKPSNVYGAGQDKNFLIPSILNQIESSNIINVNNLKTKRDFIYVKDLIEAIFKAINLERKFETITIGNGRSYSVKEVIEIVQKIKGTNLEVKSKEKIHKDEMLDIYVDTSKAKKIINWVSKWSLEEGIRDSYESK